VRKIKFFIRLWKYEYLCILSIKTTKMKEIILLTLMIAGLVAFKINNPRHITLPALTEEGVAHGLLFFMLLPQMSPNTYQYKIACWPFCIA
jgi:hypothetical protein